MSFVIASLMSRALYPFKPAAVAVESSVGGTRPTNLVPPRPTRPRNNFFHPFKRPSHHHTATPTSSQTPAVSSTSLSTHPGPSISTPVTTSALPHPINNSSRIIYPRHPQTGRQTLYNPLRPHVAAADRLFSWETPHGVRHRAQLNAALPQPLVDRAFMSIRSALAPNTKTTYAAGLKRFTQFCDEWDIDEEARMPAPYALLCAFIGEYKGRHAGSTIRSWLSGLRSWHIVNHAPWYGDDDWVHLARTSANKEGTKHKRALRAPVSIEHLAALRQAISLTDPFHAAVWAVALCTFFGCRRLGETTVTTAAAFDSKYHVLRSALYADYFPLIHIISLPFFSVLYFASYVTVRVLQASTSHGPKQQRNRELQSYSLHVTTPFALLLPLRTISRLITPFPSPAPSSPTHLPREYPKICSNTTS
jgi:hypothetical protein